MIIVINISSRQSNHHDRLFDGRNIYLVGIHDRRRPFQSQASGEIRTIVFVIEIFEADHFPKQNRKAIK